MLFTSPTFIYFFLPLSLLLHWGNLKSLRNTSLFICSLLFYAWGEPKYISILLFSIFLNWLVGVFLSSSKNRQLILFLGCFANLSLLAFFKYLDFFLSSLGQSKTIEAYFGLDVSLIHLPIGISFFTFQALSYLVDVYREEVEPQKNIIKFGLYLSLFPQLIAGPIVRYIDVVKDLDSRIFDYRNLETGFTRFCIGLSKKVLIANPAGALSDGIFTSDFSLLNFQEAWLGVVAYSIQIFYDFSGYSDMAIGIGKMLGFNFPENFNYPYIAKSIQEFWRRWHITLSGFFRDYVYIPLGGSRAGDVRTYANVMIVFLLTGLWHGASWNFVFWGIYHGIFLCLERLFLSTLLKNIYTWISHVYALFVVGIGWVIFRIEDIAQLKVYLSKMFDFRGILDSFEITTIVNLSESILAIILGIVLSMPILKILRTDKNLLFFKPIRILYRESAQSFMTGISVSMLLVFCLAKISADTYNPFIYFRF